MSYRTLQNCNLSLNGIENQSSDSIRVLRFECPMDGCIVDQISDSFGELFDSYQHSADLSHSLPVISL